MWHDSKRQTVVKQDKENSALAGGRERDCERIFQGVLVSWYFYITEFDEFLLFVLSIYDVCYVSKTHLIFTQLNHSKMVGLDYHK